MQPLNKITDTDGVVAACGGQRGALSFSFHHAHDLDDEEKRRWHDLFHGAVEFIELTRGHDEIRVVLSNHTLVVRRDGDNFAAAVVHKGHSVVKSLQRMLRMALKRLRTQPARPAELATRPTDAAAVGESAVVLDFPVDTSI